MATTLPAITLHSSISVAGKRFNFSTIQNVTKVVGATVPDGEDISEFLTKQLLAELEESLLPHVQEAVEEVTKELSVRRGKGR